MTTLRINSRGTEKLIRALRKTPKGFEKAATRAINKSLTSARARMVQLVREDVAVRAKDVRGQLEISKASWTRQYGKIIGTGKKGIPLLNYVRGSKKAPSTRRLRSGAYRPNIGVPVVIYKDRGIKPAHGVFIQRMRSGHVGAFKKTGIGDGRRTRNGRTEIKERYGPSPLKILASERYDKKLSKFTDRVMQKNVAYEVDRELKRLGLR